MRVLAMQPPGGCRFPCLQGKACMEPAIQISGEHPPSSPSIAGRSLNALMYTLMLVGRSPPAARFSLTSLDGEWLRLACREQRQGTRYSGGSRVQLGIASCLSTARDRWQQVAAANASRILLTSLPSGVLRFLSCRRQPRKGRPRRGGAADQWRVSFQVLAMAALR